MGYPFISIGPAKNRALDNAKLAGAQNVGAFITAGRKADQESTPKRKWLQLS